MSRLRVTGVPPSLAPKRTGSICLALAVAGTAAACALFAVSQLAAPDTNSAGQALAFSDRFVVPAKAAVAPVASQSDLERARAELSQAMRGSVAEVTVADLSVPKGPGSKVPLPRTRPLAAGLMANLSPSANDPRPSSSPLSEVSSALRKVFAMMQPAGVQLAFASPDGGVGSDGADRPSPMVDPAQQTALYDISARTVYMPDGSRLEAHSGLGNLLDDVRYVDVKDRGATPPQVYDLKLREKLFHGVQALRMTPIGEGDLYGRDGLLAHSYMLGPNGDSNGCVSFKDYDAFLKAFQNGHVKRLVVVKSLATQAVADAGKP